MIKSSSWNKMPNLANLVQNIMVNIVLGNLTFKHTNNEQVQCLLNQEQWP